MDAWLRAIHQLLRCLFERNAAFRTLYLIIGHAGHVLRESEQKEQHGDFTAAALYQVSEKHGKCCSICWCSTDYKRWKRCFPPKKEHKLRDPTLPLDQESARLLQQDQRLAQERSQLRDLLWTVVASSAWRGFGATVPVSVLALHNGSCWILCP